MKKHILIKDFFVEIRKSRNRFLSILIIVMLGVAFFSGVRASSPDMKLSADTYYDQVNMMDIRVLSTLGLTSEDVDALKTIEGVSQVSPSYSADVLCTLTDSQPVIKLMSLTRDMNQVTVKEGRLPEKPNEILLDKKFMESSGYKIGDTLRLSSGEEDKEIEDILSQTEYTIVGMGISPFYLSLDRGTSTIGNGTVSGFGIVPGESFSLNAFTEVYMTTDGAAKEICYSDAFDDLVSEVKDRIEDISGERCQVRYAGIEADGQEDIGQAKAEIQDAKKQLQDAREELEDAKKQLSDGKKELEEKEQELKDGKKELKGESSKLQDGRSQLETALQELQGQKNTLYQKKQELKTAKSQLEDKERELAAGEAEAAAAEQELKAGQTQLEAGKAELEKSRQALEKQKTGAEEMRAQLPQLKDRLEQLAAGLETQEGELLQEKQALETKKIELEALRQDPAADGEQILQLESEIAGLNAEIGKLEEEVRNTQAQKQGLEANISQAEQGIQQYDAGMAALTQGEQELAEKEELLTGKTAEFDAAKQTLTEGRSQLEAGRQQIQRGEQQLADGEAQLWEAEQLLNSKSGELADGEKKLKEAKKTLQDGEDQLKEAKETLKEKESELTQAEEEFEKESKDAGEEIAEGEQKVADAEEALAKLEVPTWYVLGRDSIQTYVEYGQDTERIEAIGEVFPAIFFLVAALICLTTMTRMVEENRTQIGTLKALGYEKGAIAAKYLSYAFGASFIGSVIGFLAGQKLLPVVIIGAYAILYNNLPVIQAPLYFGYSVSSTVLAVAITVAAAGAACYHEMVAVPAQLMRPESPKNGKRIFLERLTFLWKHMSFTKKAAARNLFRYKKRFFMTVLGIGGCMGLLMVGFGLKDSIVAIGEKQFGEIRTYSASISLDADSTQTEREQVYQTVQKDPQVLHSMKALETSIDVGYQDVKRSSYLVVAEDVRQFQQFVTLKDRTTKETYTLDDDGVIITEKLAKLLDVQPGDTIYLEEGETNRMEVPVSHVVENYYFHYVYMTPAIYEKLYEEPPEYMEIFTVNEDNSKAFEDVFQERYMKAAGVMNLTFLSSMADRIADMLKSMDAIIYVIVIAAGMLAFVVLYNLNNINISERKRELATLKVLGFYEMEVSEYVFRENVILTLIGAFVGVWFGLFLHRFVILTAEIDLMMFGRNIKFVSFLYSIGLTFVFSLLVNLFMHFKLRKLDMVESMKSVE